MSLIIPNQAQATYTDQAAPDSGDFAVLSMGMRGYGVVKGCAVTQRGAGANMSVDVAGGLIYVNERYAWLAPTTNVAVTAAGSSPRIDLVVANWNGVVSVVAGTAASIPVWPAIPTNSVVLAAVFVQASASTIVNANITDKRVTVKEVWDFVDEFDAGALESGELGYLGWDSGNASAVTATTGTDLHPGVVTLTETGTSWVALATSGNSVRWDQVSRAKWVVRPVSRRTGGSSGATQFMVGFATAALNTAFASTSDPARLLVAWSSNVEPNWFGLPITGSFIVDTGVAGVLTNWIDIELVRLQNGNIQYAVNGQLRALQTADLPSNGVAKMGCSVSNNNILGGTGSGVMDVDFMALKTVNGQRWT